MSDIQLIPEGFVEMEPYGPFHERNGPIYSMVRDDRVVLGMRVLEQHRSRGVNLHGGMFMTLADTALTMACIRLKQHPDQMAVTTSFSGDILAPASVGDWVEAEVEVLRAGRTAVFLNCMIRKDGPGGKPLMRFGGVFTWVDVSSR